MSTILCKKSLYLQFLTGYAEELPIKLMYYILFPIIIGFSVFMIWQIITANTLIVGITFVIISFLLGLVLLFNRIQIHIDDEVRLQLGFITSTISFDSIEDVQTDDINIIEIYGGHGYRIGGDGSIGYVTSVSSVVRIITDENKQYVVSTESPELLQAYIIEKMKG